MASVAAAWRVLVVDDEDDVHTVTRLALRRRTWRKRGFDLVSARSAKEALEKLDEAGAEPFHAAIVDVVMETPDAGLQLVDKIRARWPSSLRIVLRTGQPGSAPEEQVLNDYDIDYYLEKGDLTADKLFAVVRACLRSSQDISTLMAFSKQLQDFTQSLHGLTSLSDLLVVMKEGLRFLEAKHSARVGFAYNLEGEATVYEPHAIRGDDKDAIARLRELEPAEQPHALGTSNGGEVVHALRFAASQDELSMHGAIYASFEPDFATPKAIRDWTTDATLFVDNWRIAYRTLSLQSEVEQEKMLREQMYVDRLESIATMVTGIAHEINTPLGVANTAASHIAALLREMDAPSSEREQEDREDLGEACSLVSRNIERAHLLIKSFKQLSSSQLVDTLGRAELPAIAHDCVETMRPETKKAKVNFSVVMLGEGSTTWRGYPGHLSQVIINLMHNILRHAYPSGPGRAEIGIDPCPDSERFRIDVRDYGAGIPPEVIPRVFDAFMTTARGGGGTGLGLAIVHNIVTNLLQGEIKVISQVGEGTTFSLSIPKVLKKNDTEVEEQEDESGKQS